MNEGRTVNFSYRYVGMGSVVRETSENPLLRPQKNRIYLDVGNDLRPGVVDSHQLSTGFQINGRIYASAAALVSQCPNFILDNITPDAATVEIFVHAHPDFDAFLSAYLAKELILTSKFPDHYQQLVEYTEEVDSGRMMLNPDQPRTPFAVACTIEEVLDTEEYQYNQDLHQRIMERGLELIGFLFERLGSGAVGSLYSPDIFPEQNPFSKELEFVASDYDRYLRDLAGEGVVDKKLLRLPLYNRNQKALEEVDALFWNRPPSCSLHKYWARQDKNSPSGTGYVCTFIPFSPKEVTLPSGETRSTSRVVISVFPGSKVYLKGLAESLEHAERETERAIFGDNAGMWRSRATRRFPEPWCDNEDPWYDGRNFNYTIVDAPRVGSLLTVQQIKDITLKYARPRVKRYFTRLVFPFYFKKDKYIELCRNLEAVANTCVQGQQEREKYFLPYIRDYLFCRHKGKDQLTHCSYYKLQKKAWVKLCLAEGQAIIDDSNINGIRDRKQYTRMVLENALVTVFRYGVGFLQVDLEITQPDRLYFEEVLKINNLLCVKEGQKVYDFFTGDVFNHCAFKINVEPGLVYSAVDIHPETYYESEGREMLYKLCNVMLWDEPFSRCRYVDAMLKRMFFDVEENAIYGLSKNGCALILAADVTKRSELEDKVNDLWRSYQTTDFDIFLLALHQRLLLMDFSNDLSEFGNSRNKKKVAELRSTLLDFTTQSWFSQITHNEMGMELYNRWQDIFENKVLFEEVFGQLQAVDEYYQTTLSKNLERISAIFFPILILGTIFSTNFKEISSPAFLGHWGLVTTVVFIGWLLLYYFVLNK